jgi:serine/threonine protein kinase/WD40 repeat protein
MSDETQAQLPPGSSSDDRLDRVLADYLRQMEKGEAVDQNALLAAHPDLADDLREFFANQLQMQRLVGVGPLPGARNGVAPARLRYFGDYEILEEIAHGGMGVVYKARQTSLNRIVAVKMILAGQLAIESDVKRFQAEAEAAANLHHHGVVGIYEVGVQDGQHYYSMEYIAGQNLAQIVREKPLAIATAAEYVRDIATVLEYAHHQKVLHRDLKPSNILIDASCRVRITDFGLAKRVEGESDLTMTGQVLGTPSYMSPEQAAAQHAIIGPPTDIYALGAILYELVTGRPPFRSESIGEILRQVQHDEPVQPRLLNPKLPRDLETICLKCLEKEPKRRYGSSQLLADDLQRFLDGRPILARAISPPEQVWRWCKRKPVVAGLTAAIAVLAVSTIGLSTMVAIDQGQRRTIAESHEKETGALLGQTSKLNGELQESLHRSLLGTMHVQLQRVGDVLPQDPELARRLLLDESKCPPDMRDFAWGHYYKLANRERARFYGTATISSDAEILALVRNTGELELWNTSHLKQLSTLPRATAGCWRVLAISTNLHTLAATTTGKNLVLVDIVTGAISAGEITLPAPAQHASFSQDGKLLALVSPGAIHVVHLDNPLIEPWLAYEGESFERADFIDDGRLFATQAKAGILVVINVQTRAVELRDWGNPFVSVSRKTGAIAYLDRNHDGNNNIVLRTWENGSPQPPKPVEIPQPNSVAASDDASQVAFSYQERLGGYPSLRIATQFAIVQSAQTSPIFQLCDMEGRKHGGEATALAMPRHGRFLVACRGNGRIEMMTVPDGMQPAPLSPSVVLGQHLATKLAITDDGSTLISIGDQEACVWDLNGGYSPFPNGPASEDGTHVLVSTEVSRNTRILKILDRTTGSNRIVNKDPVGIGRTAYSRTGKFIAYQPHGEGIRIVQADPAMAQLFQVPTDEHLASIEFSPDEKSLLIAFNDRLEIWRIDVRTKLWTKTLPGGQCSSASFSPQGTTVVSMHRSGNIKLWDAADGDLRAIMTGYRYAISPNDELIVTTEPEVWALHRETKYAPELWDLRTGQKICTLRGFLGGAMSFSFSANSQILAIAGFSADKRIEVWNLGSLTLQKVLECEQFGPLRVAISPDGTVLAASGFPREVRLWNVTTGDLQGVFPFDDDYRFGFVKRFVDDSTLLLGDNVTSTILFNGSRFLEPPIVVGQPRAQISSK